MSWWTPDPRKAPDPKWQGDPIDDDEVEKIAEFGEDWRKWTTKSEGGDLPDDPD